MRSNNKFNCEKFPEPRNRFSASAKFFLLIVFALTFSISSYSQSDFVPELQPSPAYQPAEVVGIQMRALANNDQPFSNAGIELTFRFASPRNKQSTGPIERFTGLFGHPTYRAMLNHSNLEIGEAEIRENRARVPVRIQAIDGKKLIYLFELSLQDSAPYLNCWMTDGVTPVSITNSESPVVL